MRILYQSPSITIREYTDQEEAVFTSLFTDDEVTRYLPPRSADQYVEMFWTNQEDYKSSPYGRWGIFDTATSAHVGMCLLRPFADFPDQLEIGYSLSKAYWGKGLATEMAKVLVFYGFDNFPNQHIVAVTDLENIGSQKVLLKAGLVQQENLFREKEGLELAYFKIERS